MANFFNSIVKLAISSNKRKKETQKRHIRDNLVKRNSSENMNCQQIGTGACGNIKFNFDTLKSPESYSLRKFLQSMLPQSVQITAQSCLQTLPSTQRWLLPAVPKVSQSNRSDVIKPAKLTFSNSLSQNRWQTVPRRDESKS